MTKKQLIEALSKFDDNQTVVVPKLDFQCYFGEPRPRLASLKEHSQNHYGVLSQEEIKKGDTGEVVIVL